MPRPLLYGFSQHNYSITFSPAGLCFVFLLSFSFINSYAGDQIKNESYCFWTKGKSPSFWGENLLTQKEICKSTT